MTPCFSDPFTRAYFDMYTRGGSSDSCGSKASTPRKNGRLSLSSSRQSIPLRITRAAE
jgi:hypothetical protein